MTTPTISHGDTSRELLARAWACLEAGDLAQASAKGWEAAARLVEAAAAARGWAHDNPGDLHVAISRLSEETHDSQLISLFLVAASIEFNSHDDLMPRGLVASGLNQVAELVEKLEALAA